MARRRVVGSLVGAVAVLLLGWGTARAQTVVLPDIDALTEHRPYADSVSFLVRASLEMEGRPLATRRELALALEAVTGRPPRDALVVDPKQAASVQQKLTADRLLLWTLQTAGVETIVTGVLLGTDGQRLTRWSARAASGDVGRLARRMAERLAEELGGVVRPLPSVSVGELRPFVAAEAALLAGDAVAAARLLEVASPSVSEKLPAAKLLVHEVARQPQVPPATRVQLLIVAGEPEQARRVANERMNTEPTDELRAARARAATALNDTAAAAHDVAALPRTHDPQLVAARAALAIKKQDPAGLQAALGPLEGKPAADWRPALAVMSQAPSGMLPPELERAALERAASMATTEPAIAQAMAVHALASNRAETMRRASGLVQVNDMDDEQMNMVQARMEAMKMVDDPALANVRGAMDQRKAATARAVQAERAPPRPRPSTLGQELQLLFHPLITLYDPAVAEVAVAPVEGSESPFYAPLQVRPARLLEGLSEALASRPYELPALPVRSDLPLALAQTRSTALADVAPHLGGDAILLYRLTPRSWGRKVQVELWLYDHKRAELFTASAIVPGPLLGLVRLNRGLLPAALLVLLGAGVWTLVIITRGGVVVRVHWDPDATEELLCVRLSREPEKPDLEDLDAFRARVARAGRKKSRFEAFNVGRVTELRRIPRGKWYVSVHGVYRKGKQVIVVNEEPQPVDVRPRKTAFAAVDLNVKHAEFQVSVVDGKAAIAGARVWFDDNEATAIKTAANGTALMRIPYGHRVIRVETSGMLVERPYQVIKAKTHELQINLDWERRKEDVSRAIENQKEEGVA